MTDEVHFVVPPVLQFQKAAASRNATSRLAREAVERLTLRYALEGLEEEQKNELLNILDIICGWQGAPRSWFADESIKLIFVASKEFRQNECLIEALVPPRKSVR